MGATRPTTGAQRRREAAWAGRCRIAARRGLEDRLGSCLRRNDGEGRRRWRMGVQVTERGAGVTERGAGDGEGCGGDGEGCGGSEAAWVLCSARYPRRARV